MLSINPAVSFGGSMSSQSQSGQKKDEQVERWSRCLESDFILDGCRYASLAPLYYRGASAAIVAYDITAPESFQKAQYWVKVRVASLATGLTS